jgi:UDP-N-acetylenolpyruvoylglucosamine reductase, C-terminal domain
VGISHKHALAIVNRGGASAAEVLALKDQIQLRVEEIWGVKLEPEPVMVGFWSADATSLPASHRQNVGEKPGTGIASSTAVESYLIKGLAVLTGLVGNSPAAIVLPWFPIGKRCKPPLYGRSSEEIAEQIGHSNGLYLWAQTDGGWTGDLDWDRSIWCRLRDRHDVVWLGNDLLLNVRGEISNFALPEQQGQQVRPVLRQLNINASTLAVLGKPMILGSVDDPNSKRQFQLEVTVTKLR